MSSRLAMRKGTPTCRKRRRARRPGGGKGQIPLRLCKTVDGRRDMLSTKERCRVDGQGAQRGLAILGVLQNLRIQKK